MLLSKRIRKLLIEKDLSTIKLAQAVDVTEPTVRSILEGKEPKNRSMVRDVATKRILKILGIKSL